MEHMNKSNKRRRRSWWQNISTSSKVFCVVGAVLIAVVLLVCYLISMASDPKVVEKVVITTFILLVIILIIAFVACSAFDRVELGAIRDEVIGLIQAEAAKVKAEAEYYYDAVDRNILQEIDLEDEEPVEVLSEEQLAELRAEIEAGRMVNETAGQDVLERRHARQMQEHKEAERKAAEERAKEDENGTGNGEHKKPPVVREGDQPKSVVVAQILPGPNTGEIDVKLVKDITRGNADGGQPKTHPDSPEGQPKEQLREQPKTWPSVEEQAKELGISRTFLQYKLNMASVPHYSLLSEKDQDDLMAFRRRGLSVVNS